MLDYIYFHFILRLSIKIKNKIQYTIIDHDITMLVSLWGKHNEGDRRGRRAE